MITIPITDESMPNVWAFSFSNPESGTRFTFFRSVPGDTGVWMQIRTADAAPYALKSSALKTSVERPERFGSFQTKKEFRAWVEKFLEDGMLDD